MTDYWTIELKGIHFISLVSFWHFFVMSNDAPAKFSFIKYANYSVRTCNVMVALQWSQIFLVTSQKYGLVKYDRLLSNILYGAEAIR